MVRVEMLAVGKELLIGRTLNTNAHWVGGRLARMGTMLNEVTTVDDDLEEISSGLRGCLARSSDFVIVVGGLGPTPDDMTLKGIAKGLGRGMRLNDEALSLIREHYAKRGLGAIEITPARRKMALMPSGARPVRNEVGTAPGVRLESGKATVFSLPGVPSEMKSIFEHSVDPEIRERVGRLHRKYIALRLEGILESALAPIIERALKRHPGSYIKSHPRGIRDGKSRVELDIAVVGEQRRLVEQTATRIASEMRGEMEAEGASVRHSRRTTHGAGG